MLASDVLFSASESPASVRFALGVREYAENEMVASYVSCYRCGMDRMIMVPLSVGIAAILRVMLTDWMARRKRRVLLRKLRHHRACRRRAEQARAALLANEGVPDLLRRIPPARQRLLGDARTGF